MRWFVRWSIWLLGSIFLIILSVEWGKGRGQILRSREDACPQRSEGMTAVLKFTPLGASPARTYSVIETRLTEHLASHLQFTQLDIERHLLVPTVCLHDYSITRALARESIPQ